MPKEIFNRMEDLIEESGGVILICMEPQIALHDLNLNPDLNLKRMILADGHPNPTMFKNV